MMLDPSGFRVEVVWGRQAEALPSRMGRTRYNSSLQYDRQGILQNVGTRELNGRDELDMVTNKPEVLRLGHVQLNCLDYGEALEWYYTRFGLKPSDTVGIEKGGAKVALGTFSHCDRGEEYTDHHTLFLVSLPPRMQKKSNQHSTMGHCSFEVSNIDDVFIGHNLLKEKKDKEEKGYGLAWGKYNECIMHNIQFNSERHHHF